MQPASSLAQEVIASTINIDRPSSNEAATKCPEKIDKILCNFWIMIILYCSESADQPFPSIGEAMSNSSPERNKAIVLDAFETLFNKRDYAVAERFWSPNYIQHSAH
jgi:hypothetical protein